MGKEDDPIFQKHVDAIPPSQRDKFTTEVIRKINNIEYCLDEIRYSPLKEKFIPIEGEEDDQLIFDKGDIPIFERLLRNQAKYLAELGNSNPQDLDPSDGS